ncbi:LysR substrate-binding domain-containing protein [Acidovorax sp. GBBC 3334]|uniref:LysR substrate-binding domain-containing protein n=1 Tax=Acidovorax sp. GBBC 3334 TaxID=2940496 RepID=UPI0023047003|nr:LysR substrate-binding domain-containing protein [Acidovorax sp. GBBC 3334]MDA8455393.1 LysR substrate-binding domain-containing protein [Acidovorax sp. GBBC 3334]
MRFDLTDLQLFLHVHEAGTITAGAQRSHLSLASASERIVAMEQVLGAPLLVRGQRGVRATAAGQTLAHHARAVLQQMEQLRGELGAHGSGLSGHVRMLCNTSAMSEHLPGPLAAFLAAHPRTAVDAQERGSDEVADNVRGGLCDIGIASRAADLQGLETHPFVADPLVLVVPPGHRLAGRGALALADAAGEDFAGLPEDSALQAHLARQARREGRRLRYRARLQHVDAVCRLVGLGAGLVAIVPRASALRLARSTRVQRVALTDPWAARELVLCVRPDAGALPAHARALLEHLAAR